ncbi:hypothetical protein [Planctomyces sp. SH-PL62]|uniref:hypothetical protein n=1 Tax=Planctomyces sp. SH-PL62 TaxID=1636152 RepID=UPI00078BC3AF|nr:hypothetical protein [Planctomyces sp. SH-PL62]AMV39276.1 hypothetical protein VT85_17695 [Planctomyces sp. SH-PL62]
MSYRMGAVLALTLAATTASASVSAATPDEVVATFLDDQATAVCRIKLDRVKVDEFLGGLGEAALLENRLGPWVEALRKAGARELYLVATLDDLPPGPTPPPTALVPIEDGADAQAIGALLCGGPSTGGRGPGRPAPRSGARSWPATTPCWSGPEA